jgi:exodeoxyribonuclease VII large subunit
MAPLTVTQFVEAINISLEALAGVVVEGEVDEFKIIHSKWVTFQLKDEGSSIGCFMPIWQFKTQIEDGMLVRVTGKPALRNKGFFSFVATDIQPAGEGSLKRAFELLLKKLTGEGLFDAARKRPLPRFPQTIALITSRDAAAYSDFIKVLEARHGGLTIYFLHVQVQGEPAPQQIIQALEYANAGLPALDAIVMIRGGGSLEDLQAFNDETVVRAVAASRTPTIVGIGHERDVTLAELAADLRASTPSNAAELLVRSRVEIVATLDRVIAYRQRFLDTARAYGERVARLQQRLLEAVRADIRHRQQALDGMTRLLNSLSPQNVLGRGFSITRSKKGTVLKSATAVKSGDTLVTQLAEGTVQSEAK